jgi:alkanesulfonate monooxygenase SsuD/methylene tetrahydromethanopterin reductase-like flavin-dependent oxidoreductase (luciferase family)
VKTAGHLTARTAEYAAEAGRQVATYVLIAVVVEETDDKAQQVAAHLAETVALAAVEKWRELGVADAGGSASERHKADAFMGVTSVIGSYERVAAYFDHLSQLGIRGAVIFFPDWNNSFPTGTMTFASSARMLSRSSALACASPERPPYRQRPGQLAAKKA